MRHQLGKTSVIAAFYLWQIEQVERGIKKLKKKNNRRKNK